MASIRNMSKRYKSTPILRKLAKYAYAMFQCSLRFICLLLLALCKLRIADTWDKGR